MTSRQAEGRAPHPAPTESPAAKPDTRDSSEDVDEMLRTLGFYRTAAREIADGDAPLKSKYTALRELHRQASREALPAFAEAAVWGAARHLFEPDRGVPKRIIDAIRRLLRQGHSDCPSCRRPLPTHAEVDRWEALGSEAILRRPA